MRSFHVLPTKSWLWQGEVALVDQQQLSSFIYQSHFRVKTGLEVSLQVRYFFLVPPGEKRIRGERRPQTPFTRYTWKESSKFSLIISPSVPFLIAGYAHTHSSVPKKRLLPCRHHYATHFYHHLVLSCDPSYYTISFLSASAYTKWVFYESRSDQEGDSTSVFSRPRPGVGSGLVFPQSFLVQFFIIWKGKLTSSKVVIRISSASDFWKIRVQENKELFYCLFSDKNSCVIFYKCLCGVIFSHIIDSRGECVFVVCWRTLFLRDWQAGLVKVRCQKYDIFKRV